MENTVFRKNAYDMIYLSRCAVSGEIPDAERIQNMNPEQLFQVCETHILTACAAYALESAGIRYHEFTQAKEKAVRKNILLDAERRKILSRLEQEKIWYMPLKGAILKDWYPKLGMRQMSDNDILCDVNFRKQIRKIMLELGFTCEHYGKGNDDAYFKPPVCNFEMHHELFNPTHAGKLHEYYADVKQRLLKDENNQYGWHFRTEDFYIYMIAHEYKHYAGGGTGVRSLLDIYIFLKKYGELLNWNKIQEELQTLEISEFERHSRELAVQVFSGEPLTEQESKLLDYYIFSGTYGTMDNQAKHRIDNFTKDKGKFARTKYVFRKCFPSMEEVKTWYPFFYRHKLLMPVLWFVVKPYRLLSVRRKQNLAELKYLIRKKM